MHETFNFGSRSHEPEDRFVCLGGSIILNPLGRVVFLVFVTIIINLTNADGSSTVAIPRT